MQLIKQEPEDEDEKPQVRQDARSELRPIRKRIKNDGSPAGASIDSRTTSQTMTTTTQNNGDNIRLNKFESKTNCDFVNRRQQRLTILHHDRDLSDGDRDEDLENINQDENINQQLEQHPQQQAGITSTDFDEDDLANDKGNENFPSKPSANVVARRHHQREISNSNLKALMSLIDVIKKGTYDEFMQLLQGKEFNKYLLNVFVDGQTALHYSLMYGRNLAWCKELISCGSNPNLMNQDGWHPIHLAAYTGCRDTMLYLIDIA